MRKSIYLLFIAIFCTAGSIHAQSNLKWYTNLEKAQKVAKKQSKPVLVYFTGSDWCAPCKTLKVDFFETERFANLANEVILVEIDIPRRIDIVSKKQLAYNKEIVAKLNKDKSFPKLIAFTSRGRKIDEVSGYGSLRDPVHYFALVEKAKSK
ncbi:MAG: thioredoxin family protein [Gilvibacter sp.]